MKNIELVDTPGKKTINEVAEFLGEQPERLLKTIIYSADSKPVVALVRGDYEINEAKLKLFLGSDILELADDKTVKQVTGASTGFAGPVGLKGISVVADYSVRAMENFVTGANVDDKHLKNANIGRDFTLTEYQDIRTAVEGDSCPRCESGKLSFMRGIEVGHVFKLGTKYSNALKSTFLDQNGDEKLMVMGCYGIGVGRTVAAAIEQNYDENGIIWPLPIAPFSVIVLPVNVNHHEVMVTALEIYNELMEYGAEVLLDDRDERPGVKFKDADLIGIPYRVTIGEKNLKTGKVEIRVRRTGETILIDSNDAVEHLKNLLRL